MTRHLTTNEINDIISFVPKNKYLPSEIRDNNYDGIVKKLVKDLQEIKIYPQMIPKLASIIERKYNESLIQAGEMVGILCAQSIGEKQTQSTLNTFHKAGSSTQTLSTGVSRFSELINTYKEPKHQVMRLYPTLKTRNISEIRDFIDHDIVEIKIKDIIREVTYNKEEDHVKKYWEHFFYDVYTDFSPPMFDECVVMECSVDHDKLYEYHIQLLQIAQKINQTFDELYCIFSPDCDSTLKIYIDVNSENVSTDTDEMNQDKVVDAFIQNIVLPSLENVFLCGIKGIEDLYFLKDNDGFYYFETKGSNLSESTSCDKINTNLTYSNNIWEIYDTLGIEATRQFLIDEFMDIMSGINMCHVKILVDRMTFTGSVSSVSRYTMRKDDCGPLTKASFEETVDTFIKASVFGKCETTKGVSSAIICGKKSNVGTGMCSLKIDFDKVLSMGRNPLPCSETKQPKQIESKSKNVMSEKVTLESPTVESNHCTNSPVLEIIQSKKTVGKVYIGSFNVKGKRSSLPDCSDIEVVNVTSCQPKSNINRQTFCTLNPVQDGYKGYYCFEHYWQSGKVYENIPEQYCEQWFKKQTKPKRICPKTKGSSLMYHKFGDDVKLNIIESRQKVYVPEYWNLIKDKERTLLLKEMVNKGQNVVIYDINGPRDDNGTPITLEVTQDVLEQKLKDTKNEFGHGYIVASCILNIDPSMYT